MTTFVCTDLPYLKILLSDGDYVQFQGGRLEVPETDPFHGEVMAEASRNSHISVMTNETTCQYCGAVFSGDKAQKSLATHFKDAHFELWVKQSELDAAIVTQREIKARAGYVCDICAPVQTFGTEADLAEHTRLLHTAPPAMDEDGNETGPRHDAGDGDDGRRPGEVDPPKAATRSRGKATAK